MDLANTEEQRVYFAGQILPVLLANHNAKALSSDAGVMENIFASTWAFADKMVAAGQPEPSPNDGPFLMSD